MFQEMFQVISPTVPSIPDPWMRHKMLGLQDKFEEFCGQVTLGNSQHRLNSYFQIELLGMSQYTYHLYLKIDFQGNLKNKKC